MCPLSGDVAINRAWMVLVHADIICPVLFWASLNVRSVLYSATGVEHCEVGSRVALFLEGLWLLVVVLVLLPLLYLVTVPAVCREIAVLLFSAGGACFWCNDHNLRFARDKILGWRRPW